MSRGGSESGTGERVESRTSSSSRGANDRSLAPGEETVIEEYVFDIRIVEYRPPGEEEPRYRFDAPEHREMVFDDRRTAELYADVYFDVNGFEEAGTGDRGVPPEIIQAGKDTIAAYLLTRSGVDADWMASFYGVRREKIDRYASWVHERAEEIRAGAADLESA